MVAIQSNPRRSQPVEDVPAELWRALWQVDTLRSLDLTSLSLSVQAGRLLLEGHLASDLSRRQILTIAGSLTSIGEVVDHLVVDRDLAVGVTQALAADERTRSFRIFVACDHGWIRLNGEVPDGVARQDAEEVAAQVPYGRGVVALPAVAGEALTPLRRALQPLPGARVWGEDGELGRVAQVVIDPHNRLVTDVIVARREVREFQRLHGDYVVPVSAIEIANAESVFLAHPHRSITEFPTLSEPAYPLAPATWRPPYPYRAGGVRWPQDGPGIVAQGPASSGERPASGSTPAGRPVPSSVAVDGNESSSHKNPIGGAS